jgi:hypothetical protein
LETYAKNHSPKSKIERQLEIDPKDFLRFERRKQSRFMSDGAKIDCFFVPKIIRVACFGSLFFENVTFNSKNDVLLAVHIV